MKRKTKTTKTKKKKSKKPQTSPLLKSVIFVLVLLIVGLGAFLGKLVYEKNQAQKELVKTKNTLMELKKKVSKLEKELKEKPKVSKKETHSEIADYKEASKVIMPPPPPPKEEKPKPVISKPGVSSNKPKLVIIIDDVSFRSHVRAIKSLPFKITPSFFPPNKMHPNTPIYAREFKDYMVHVPMEAISWNKPELHTLKTTSSYLEIYETINSIKKEFPRVKFINNHTGSKFTSDLPSMKKLFRVLEIENMGFVDSRTTPNSKALLAKKSYDIPLYSRNIFIDNEENISYIHNQLKKAVRIAQKRGYAIAIGHPHKVTFQALKSAKNILKNVEVVTIDELYDSKN